MSIARAWSVALVGMEGAMVEVEAALGSGLPRTVLVGLPDTSLYEARDRCKAAMASARIGWPSQLLTINLSPATLPKTGSHYDLSIAAAVTAVAGRCPTDLLDSTVFLGELGLDGRVRRVRGILPAVLAARRAGMASVVVPAGQAGEAALVEGMVVWGVRHLGDVLDVLHGRPVTGTPQAEAEGEAAEPPSAKDLIDVVGQVEAKWALEVAAAGRHHVYLHGPPGVGKTLLAERLPSLLPDLSPEESLEVSAVLSLAGASLGEGLVRRPPYAAPHHSASVASLVGGGARIALPGSVSKAHKGILFLDEAPEFSVRALEALRVPLESGRIVLGRSMSTTVYPASFQLVLAANPCPCGNAATPGADCRCPPMAVRRYAQRVSGPILDRVDIHQHLRPMRKSYLKAAFGAGESSATVAARVAEARARMRRRLSPEGWCSNGEVPGPPLRRSLPLPAGTEVLDDAVRMGKLSARGVDKVLRLSWTVADLAGRDRPAREHLMAALALRRGEEAVR